MMTELENVVRDGLLTAGDPDNALARLAVGKVLRRNLIELARARGARSRSSRWCAGLLASVLQVRPRITTAAIKPSFKKLNPLTGFKRVFGVERAGRGGKAIAKTVVVGAVDVLRHLAASCRASASSSASPRPRS